MITNKAIVALIRALSWFLMGLRALHNDQDEQALHAAEWMDHYADELEASDDNE